MIKLPSWRDVVPEIASASNTSFAQPVDKAIASGIKRRFVGLLHGSSHAARHNHDLHMGDSGRITWSEGKMRNGADVFIVCARKINMVIIMIKFRFLRWADS